MNTLFFKGPLCFLLVLFTASCQRTDDGKNNTSRQFSPRSIRMDQQIDNLQKQADSLLKLGNSDSALELYFKAVDGNRPSIPLVYPIFKKIADVYVQKREYQKAIYFFREYQWMAELDILYSRDTLPDIDLTDEFSLIHGAMWTLSTQGEFSPLTDSARNQLGQDLNEFSAWLKEFEGKSIK